MMFTDASFSCVQQHKNCVHVRIECMLEKPLIIEQELGTGGLCTI